MPNKSSLRVSNAPPKPLLIWDGECDFCRLWIERWREITEGKVDYATYQEAAVRFPEIPVDQFTRAMAFIKPDGDVLLGTALVSARAWHDLSDRVRVALGAGGWARRQQRHVAGESISAGSSRPNRTRRLRSSAHPVLVRSERRIPSFSLR